VGETTRGVERRHRAARLTRYRLVYLASQGLTDNARACVLGGVPESRYETKRLRSARRSALASRLAKYRLVYLLILPALVGVLLFSYVPMLGISMAFKNYKLGTGFWGVFTSPGVGLANFRSLFVSYYFWQILRNTLLISLYKMLFVFPTPILLALLLNELRAMRFKRVVQTISYLPYFLSAVIIQGLALAVFSPSYGFVNNIMQLLGARAHHFLADARYFRAIIVGIDVWQGMGWGAIIYLAAIATIDPEQYEAAIIDGAGRIRQAWSVTLAGISDIIILLFILRVGDVLNAGFEKIFLLYSPAVYSVGDIIDTYAYREGLINSNFGFATAVGLFKSVVGLALIMITNRVANRFGRQGIW
jgi:putative aldouronate transport system permease protein